MAIKGTTKIQLFDAKTGELTDEIVKENMITNAVPNILNPSLQMFMGNKGEDYDAKCDIANFLRRCSPIGKHLFGGVLVFSEPLAEDVDHIIPSISERSSIVGYAGRFESVIGNKYKGSYNETESMELENGFTHVWDFSTEQANGEIAAVALTSAMGGDCGWDTSELGRGNFLIPITGADFTAKSKATMPGYGSNNGTYTLRGFQYTTERYLNGVVVNGEYVMTIGVSDTDGKLNVVYNVKSFKDINLTQDINNNTFSDSGVVTSGSKLIDDIPYEVRYTSSQIKDNVYKLCVAIDYAASVNSENTIYFIDFILNDDGSVTITEPVSVTVKTNDIITVINSELAPSTDMSNQVLRLCFKEMAVLDNYLYLQTMKWNGRGINTHFVRINMNNTSDITLFKKPNGSSAEFFFGFFEGEVILHEYDSQKFYRTTDFVNYYLLDQQVITRGMNVFQDYNITPIKKPYVLLSFIDNWNVTIASGVYYEPYVIYVVPYLLAPYLATINNLETVVTKTSSRTMKITYTIQNV